MGFHNRWNGDVPSLMEADGGNASIHGAIFAAFMQLAAKGTHDKIEEAAMKPLRGLQELPPDDGADEEDENGEDGA